MPSGLDLLKSTGGPDVENSKRSGVKSSHGPESMMPMQRVGAKSLRHFEQAFLTHEDANNRV
eukprot:scaffold84524_cov57-Phaeocystis_antarctica.AAC.1